MLKWQRTTGFFFFFGGGGGGGGGTFSQQGTYFSFLSNTSKTNVFDRQNDDP